MVIGHRGSPRKAPENSLSGFLIAFEDGADMVELDVRLNQDGTPMVFHDDTLPRMVGHPGRLDHLSNEECQQAFIGRRHGGAFRREPIPPLARVLEEIKRLGGRVNIEIKETRAVEPVVRMVQRLRLHDQVLISAFDWRALDKVRRQDAGITLGALYQFHLMPLTALRHGVSALHPYHFSVLPGHVPLAHSLGLLVNTWTVNQSRDWSRLIENDVDGLITDTPGLLVQWLKDHLTG